MQRLTALGQDIRARIDFRLEPAPPARRQRIFSNIGVDLVLDVGAATGGYGNQIRKFGYQGTIVSFEPLEKAYDALCKTAQDDATWHTSNFAIGAQAAMAEINVASNSNSSSLLPMLDAHHTGAPSVKYVATEEVRVEALDTLARDYIAGAQRPFLKIDAQGYERSVLAGAAESLMQIAGLQLEMSFVPLYDGGMLIDETIAWAYSRDFHLVSFERGFTSATGEMLQADGIFVRNGLLANNLDSKPDDGQIDQRDRD